MSVIHEAWSDEYSTKSWVVVQKSTYPLLRLVLGFNVARRDDGLGNVLGRKVHEWADVGGHGILILVVVNGLAHYKCLAYPKSRISI